MLHSFSIKSIFYDKMDLRLFYLHVTILLKGHKPDNFESHNSLKLSFTYIQGLHSNFFECESFLESNSPDILTLCETNLDHSTDSGNFSERGYLSLIRKDSVTHMHGFAVYVTEQLPFAPNLSLENLFMFSTNFTSFSVLLLCPLPITFFIFKCGF